MLDTPDYILKKQFEIINSKSIKEREKLIFDQTMSAIEIIKKRIKLQNPEISDKELKIEFFKIFYKNDFSEVEMNKIVDFFRQN